MRDKVSERTTIVAERARLDLYQLVAATRGIDSENTVYSVLASMSSALLAQKQVFENLAIWHRENLARASDTGGGRTEGQQLAIAASADLIEAARLASDAIEAVESAWARSGRVIWEPNAGDPEAVDVQVQLAPPEAFGPPLLKGDDGLGPQTP